MMMILTPMAGDSAGESETANKINSMTQGFYIDGLRFAFVHITEDDIFKSSEIFDVRAPKGLKYIFSFIVSMMETAMKSMPTTIGRSASPRMRIGRKSTR